MSATELPPHLLGIKSKGLGVCGWILFSFSFLSMVITFPISIWMCLKIIKEYERAVVFRLGRIQADKAKGPPGMTLQLLVIRIMGTCTQVSVTFLNMSNFQRGSLLRRLGHFK
uniref:Stomatin-like protein 3 n=1 Tax=Monodon monoceros TaxID=40151 RepID=A0A8C6C4G7_MONMO